MKPSQVPFIINFGIAAPDISEQAAAHGWVLTPEQGKILNGENTSLDYLHIQGIISTAARRHGRMRLCKQIPAFHKANKAAAK